VGRQNRFTTFCYDALPGGGRGRHFHWGCRPTHDVVVREVSEDWQVAQASALAQVKGRTCQRFPAA